MVMTQGYASRPCRAAHPGLRPLRPSRASILPIGHPAKQPNKTNIPILPIGHPAKQPNKTNIPILPIGRPIYYTHPAHWPFCQTTEQNKYTHPAHYAALSIMPILPIMAALPNNRTKQIYPPCPLCRPIHYAHPAHYGRPAKQPNKTNIPTLPIMPPYPLCPSCPLWPPCQTTEQKQNRPHAARHGADCYHCGADALSAPPPSACSPHTRRPARPACGARRQRAGRWPPAVRRRCRRRSVWRCRRLP